MSGNIGELEREFFDELAKSIQMVEFSKTTDSYIRCAFRALGNLREKRVLDVGCGDGKNTYMMAARAGSVFGIDISMGMLKRADTLREGRKNLFILEMDSENMGFREEAFDLIFGGYILHHLDIPPGLSEVYRVLKKGGMGVFIENFAFNPIINFFRENLVGRFGIPRYGTPGEHPLTYRDLKIAKSFFGRVEIRNPDLNFMKLFDRQIFRYRCPIFSRFCGLFDRWMYHSFKGLRKFSYTQVLVMRK
ncbi:hypothetical protein CH333_06855 [candidate division WOR-3 bacterium JGI_Cruoil_03_44_89]|uniref:Methyltransferase type 11 domain-containing protein n=1 Tax=candidate division WOR-3 bacterium JGI_Cruoil_03_44_89 TaxID=1973748 RepID=A0A235BS21_UNCW3|nr:MAG: hypothetical protein CH333_06855 [candidate division WOR-3 bacterium JGI_Cruoil_03_44_89]